MKNRTSALLNSNGQFSELFRSFQINSWEQAINHIKNLPYGRNKNREDLNLVILEGKGSCSSKHALAKSLAIENNLRGIHLILGVFKMNGTNTPKIKPILNKYKIDFIPEFHCYLKDHDTYIDLTNPDSQYESFKKDILEEQEIDPDYIIDRKAVDHRKYLRKWKESYETQYSFEEIWKIREECIAALSKH